MLKDMIEEGCVNICPLKKANLEIYLKVLKRASPFSVAYESVPEFWENERKSIEQEVDKAEKNLIIVKSSGLACGFIGVEYDDDNQPEIDIAIVPEFRRQGYGYHAAKLLCDKLLADNSVKYINWHTFSSNVASRRIAEKLGGVIVEGKNLIAEAMAAGFNKDVKEFADVPEMITYKISKESVTDA